MELIIQNGIIEEIDRVTVDSHLYDKSNLNTALPIDCGQTISQPLIVALMTQHLEVKSMRVLEVERVVVIKHWFYLRLLSLCIL